jgi:hypothetical protein
MIITVVRYIGIYSNIDIGVITVWKVLMCDIRT